MNTFSTWLWSGKATEDVNVDAQEVRVATRQTAGSDTTSEPATTSRGTGKEEPQAGIEDESTPKAKATTIDSTVPAFSLDEPRTTPEAIPSSPSRDRLSSDRSTTVESGAPMPPPSTVVKNGRSSQTSLMPPPAMKAPPSRTLQSAAGGLRVPSTGPLPNRGPPPSQASQLRSSLSPMAKTPVARAKVVLEPGHSPLDWATLSQAGNLSGVSSLKRVTPSMLKEHNGRKGRPAWSSYHGKVYNITPYVPFHPGGKGEILRGAGKDGGKLFMEAHPWVNWENMLNSCIVGVMVSESEGQGLDEMD